MAKDRTLRVLVVDDEKDFVDSLKERMELRDMEVTPAYSGEDALEKAHEKKFHAAIVDLKMPGIDGLVTITKLKEINPKIHTVLLTGYGDEKTKQATEALNSDYFEKGEMTSFWDFVKALPKKLEDTMAASGMASYGDINEADRMSHEDED
jgi:DNA-binding NtrC family response regulator